MPRQSGNNSTAETDKRAADYADENERGYDETMIERHKGATSETAAAPHMKSPSSNASSYAVVSTLSIVLATPSLGFVAP